MNIEKLLLFSLLFISIKANGQVRYSNSKFGINNANPTEALHVSGNIKATGTIHATAGILDDSLQTGIASQILSSTGNGTFWVDKPTISWTVSGSNIYNNNVGNVGIGTTTPDKELTILSNTPEINIQDSDNISAGVSKVNFNGTAFGVPALMSYVGHNGAASLDLWGYASNYLRFGTNNVEVGRWDTNGNLGIGTTAPGDKLTVYESVNGSVTMSVTNPNSGTNVYSQLVAKNGNSAEDSGRLGTTGTAYNGTGLFATDGVFIDSGTNMSAGLSIGSRSTAATAGIKFFTNGSSSERMTIKTDGKIGVSTTAPTRQFSVQGTGQIQTYSDVTTDNGQGVYWHSNNDYAIRRSTGTWTAPDYQQLELNFVTGIKLQPGTGDNTGYGKSWVEITKGKGLRVTQGDVGIGMTNTSVELDVTGDIEYTGTITDVSDFRLKKNIKRLKGSLEKIKGIQGVSYQMKDDPENKKQYGVIAQNVQDYLPDAVSIIDPVKKYLGVDYTQLVAPLIEAVKEQQTQIERQKEQIQLLIKEVKKLKKK